MLTGLLTLGAVSLVMTRRIVSFSSRGFYLVEETLALITLMISASLTSLSVALFQMFSGYVDRLILLSVLAPPLSLVLYLVGTDIGDVLTTRDVAS